MIALSVRGDLKRFERRLTEVQKKVIPPARTAALNRVITQLRTRIVREVASDLALKAGPLRKKTWINKARFDKAEASVAVSKVGMLSRDARARPVQGDAGASVGPHSFPGSFVATLKSGHKGIFKRRGQKRLPIDERHIPIRDAVARAGVQLLRSFGLPTFRKRYLHELERRLARLRR